MTHTIRSKEIHHATKPRRPRDPAKEKLWRRIIRRHQQSDFPVSAFCQREGLTRIMHTDDTPSPVWDPTLPQTRTGRFWAYIGDIRHPYVVYVVYDYTPRRTHDGPEQFLKGFRG